MIKPRIGPPSSPSSLSSVVLLGGGGGIILEPGGILSEPVGPGGILLQPVGPDGTVPPSAPALEGAEEDLVTGGGHTTDTISIATVNAAKSFIF